MSESPTPGSLPPRITWFVLWGALSLGPVAYVVLAWIIAAPVEPAPQWTMIRMAFMGLAALAFFAGWFVMSRAGSAGGWPPVPAAPGGAASPPDAQDLAPPAVFQTRSIVAMAFFESIAVYGWVLVMMGGPRLQLVPWSAASLAGLVGIVLPNGLAYWRRWEMAAAGTRPTAIG